MAADAASVAVADPPPDVNDQSSTAPRKRRRRAPTTGAADDCFACQDARTTCDRRRPYCTQCIERGKTCSGYKTQLTWGVGVASRGKLRGLSLPIVSQKNKKAPVSSKKPSKSKSSAKSSTDSQQRPPTPTTTKFSPNPPSSTFTATADLKHDFSLPVSQDPVQSPATTSFTWTAPTSTRPTIASTQPQNPKKNHQRRHSLQPLQMPPPSVNAEFSPMPMTAGVFGGYHGATFDSAISDSPLTPSYQQYHGSMGMDRHYPMQQQWPVGSFHDRYQSAVSSSSWHSTDSLDSNVNSEQSMNGYHEDEAFYPDQSVMKNLDIMLNDNGMNPFSNEAQYIGQTQEEQEQDQYEDLDGLVIVNTQYNSSRQELSLFSGSLSAPSIGKTHGLRELINYYDKVIAPVIVAFDGPTNPYRNHILRLASDCEALQHAIAALSASNIRMRREHEPLVSQTQKLLTDSNAPETIHDVSVRNSARAHNMLRTAVEQADIGGAAGKHSQRELYHKGESIKALNATLSQLREQSLGNDDTVLATLLVLCLYHICDTGVAKFRTQFAGVKKLLALRHKRSGAASRDSGWLLTMFRWFDAMTATVNDREGQFDEDLWSTGPSGIAGELGRASGIGTSADEPEEWALENLAGCDGRLFRIISKLGRLNLLSQGKPVNEGAATPRPKPPRQPADLDPSGPAFDGNGWGQILSDSDLLAPSPDDEPPTANTQFGAEWWALRQELYDWQFDPQTVPPSMRAPVASPPDPQTQQASPSSTDPPATPAAVAAAAAAGDDLAATAGGADPHTRDLHHISEAFRHSALLYLERLAFPRRASSAPGFRVLVEAAIAHIRVVKSDVYLLWPLFITGTECVDDAHRELIRGRCRGIQSDSGFYNNTSTLTLLERIWADRDHLGPEAYASDTDVLRGGAFKWRKAMDLGEEEYIVI